MIAFFFFFLQKSCLRLLRASKIVYTLNIINYACIQIKKKR